MGSPVNTYMWTNQIVPQRRYSFGGSGSKTMLHVASTPSKQKDDGMWRSGSFWAIITRFWLARVQQQLPSVITRREYSHISNTFFSGVAGATYPSLFPGSLLQPGRKSRWHQQLAMSGHSLISRPALCTTSYNEKLRVARLERRLMQANIHSFFFQSYLYTLG